MLKVWLKNTNVLRERAHKYKTDNDIIDSALAKDDVYIEQEENLKRFSTPNFYQWQLRHHIATLTQYIHSTEELKPQLKKQCRT